MIKLTPTQKAKLTPFARWLLEYVREHETNLTELSRRAGLSLGALRSLIIYPERTPTLETCLQLAKATGLADEELIQLAGLKVAASVAALDPDRIQLIRAYDGLPDPQLRHLLAEVGQLFLTRAADRTSGGQA